MEAPQITIILLWALGLGLTWAKHGEPKTGNENVFTALAGIGTFAAILWWGGFFS